MCTSMTYCRCSLSPLPVQELDFDDYAAVQQLSGLAQLEHLGIWASDWDENNRLQRYLQNTTTPVLPPQLLSCLTALTRLESNLFGVNPLTGISSCVGLQHLSVCVGTTRRQLGSDEWSCVASLTCLTQLRLLNIDMPEACSEACAALSKLKKL